MTATLAANAASLSGERYLSQRDRSLTERYDAAASAWQRKVDRLGYKDAYASMIARGEGLITATLSRQPLSVLDAGAGTGAFALALLGSLARATPRIDASVDLLDPSQAMLDEAIRSLASNGHRARGLCQYIQSLAPRLPTYDIVLCSHVIEHSAMPGRELSILRSVLKPGGVLFLVVSKPSWLTRLLQVRWRHRAFCEPAARMLLRDAGFRCAESFSFPKGPPLLTSMGYMAVAPCDSP